MSSKDNDLKINGAISKNEEIQKRLQSQEAQKAMKLLALAMSHHEALKMVKAGIEEKVNGK